MSSLVTTKSVLLKLTENRELNAPLVNVTERNCHENVKMTGDSVGFKDKVSGTHMYSADNWETLKALLEDTGEELDTFMINTVNYKKEILRMFPEAITSEYDLYVMNKKDYTLCSLPIEDFELTNLDLSWLDFILDRYKDKEFGHKRYISDRIINGPGLGYLHQGNKAAFVLQHKDGESGPLIVDRKYRGRGLGRALLKRFNGLLFEKNSILYGLVEKNNMTSASMMVNSGYKKEKNNVLWVYRMKNGTLYLP